MNILRQSIIALLISAACWGGYHFLMKTKPEPRKLPQIKKVKNVDATRMRKVDFPMLIETFGTVEAVKTVENLIAPLSGEVLEANEVLEEDAELINKDPYGAGWLIKIRIEDEDELEALLSAQDYSDMLDGS